MPLASLILILIFANCFDAKGALRFESFEVSKNSQGLEVTDGSEQFISNIFIEHLKRKELEKAKLILNDVIRENYPEVMNQLARQIVEDRWLSQIWFETPLQRDLSRAYALLLYPDWLTVPGLIKFCFNFDCCFWCSLKETINEVNIPPHVQKIMIKALEGEVLRNLDGGEGFHKPITFWKLLKPTAQQVLSMSQVFIASHEWTLSYQKSEFFKTPFTYFLEQLEKKSLDLSNIRVLLHHIQDFYGVSIQHSNNPIQELTIIMFLYHSRHCSQLKKLLKNKPNEMMKFMDVTSKQFASMQKYL